MKSDQSDSSKLNALRETLFDSPGVALVGLLIMLLLVWFFWLQPGDSKKPAPVAAALPPASAGAAAFIVASAPPQPAAAGAAPIAASDNAVATADSGSHTVVMLTSKPAFMSDADWNRLQTQAASASNSQQAAQLKELLDMQQKFSSWQTTQQPAMREQLTQQMLQKMPEWVASGAVTPEQAQQMQQALLNNANNSSNAPPAGYGNGNAYGSGGNMPPGNGMDNLQSPVPTNNGMSQ